MYYILMTLFDIGFYITENWRELTLNALACGIGVIIGKRLGSRLVVQQMMKLLGLEKKSKLEQKVDFLIDIEAGRGNVWAGNTETSSNTDQRSLKRSFLSLQVALSRKGKWNMSKFKSRKFILAVVGAILIILNDGLGLGIESETVLAFAGLLAVWITGESAVDATRAVKGANKDAELNIPIEPPL